MEIANLNVDHVFEANLVSFVLTAAFTERERGPSFTALRDRKTLDLIGSCSMQTRTLN